MPTLQKDTPVCQGDCTQGEAWNLKKQKSHTIP